MCGRYHNRFQKQQIAEAFSARIRPTLTPERMQSIGVRTDTVEYKQLSDDRRQRQIGGRTTKLRLHTRRIDDNNPIELHSLRQYGGIRRNPGEHLLGSSMLIT